MEQTITRRLDSLAPPLRSTIDLAAVLGERFGFDLLCAAGDDEPQALLAAVRELVQRRFLDETEKDYRFGHDKVRQVAYEGIDALQRSGLHRRVAQAFEALQPERVATLAHHWTRAEEWELGADYHQQAGDWARVVYANAEAVVHYSQALDALERLPGPVDPVLSYELHLAREAIYDLLGEREKQAGDLRALEKLAKRLDDDRRMTAALRQGNYYLSTGDYSTAHLYLEQTLQRARAEDDRHREATSLSLLGKFHGDLGDSTAAQDHFKQALAIHRAIGDYLGEVKDLSSLGTAYSFVGDYPAAKDYYKQSLALSQSTKNFQMEGYNLCSLGRLSRQLGHLEAAQEYNSQALTIMRAIGHRYIEVYCLQELGNLHYILGDCMLARKTLEQAANISSHVGNLRGEGYALSDLGLVYHSLGDDEMALAHCKQGRDRLCVVGDRWGEGGSWNYIGQALEGLGDLDAASEAYGQALTIKREIGQNAWAVEDLTGLARVALAQGRMAEALKQVDEALAWIAQHGITGLELSLLVYLTAYQVLDAAGYVERAGAVLTEAHDLLMERAAKIRDEKLRRSFLENVAAHREILAAYRESQIVPQEGRLVVLLPRADAPQGRPLRDDEYVTVTWTVDAAEDAAIQGKAARRQRRILRLLDEAEAQGAVPRDQDLARALGMSLRTLRRDVAALRAAGHALPARRRKMAS